MAQEPLVHSGSPVVAELAADAPRFAEHGPSRTFAFVAENDASLFAWATSSDFDPLLHVAFGGRSLTDEDSGGGNVPLLSVDVRAGDRLEITVAATAPASTGRFELHLSSAPETSATREATARARSRLQTAEEHRSGERHDEARREVSAALAELLAVPGAALSSRVASVLWDLGQLAYRLGDPATAAQAWDVVRTFRERHLPPASRQVTNVRINSGAMLLALGKTAPARDVLARLVETLSNSLPEDSGLLQFARLNLASCHHNLGELHAALRLRRTVLAVYERTKDAADRDLLMLRTDLGSTLYRLGLLEAAEQQFRVALEAAAPLATTHPDTLIFLQGRLAELARHQGHLLGARTLQEEVLRFQEQHLTEDNRELVVSRTSLAQTLFLLGEHPPLPVTTVQSPRAGSRERCGPPAIWNGPAPWPRNVWSG